MLYEFIYIHTKLTESLIECKKEKKEKKEERKICWASFVLQQTLTPPLKLDGDRMKPPTCEGGVDVAGQVEV